MIKVLLIEGGDQQVLPMAKSFKELGCHVTTYNTNKLVPGYASKYPDKKIIAFFDEKEPEKSYQAIKEVLQNGDYDMVIPLNDYVAAVLSKHKEEFSAYAKMEVNDWDIFQRASDKANTMGICMKNNIPCPKTYAKMEEFLKDDTCSYPIVIKPRTGQGAVGFHVSENKEDAVAYYEGATKKFGPCLIQEYIPQTDLQYKAEIYIDRDGEMKAACVFAKLRWYPINGGSSTLNKTVDRPDIIDSCGKLLKQMGWRGYADIDLIQDPRDGVAKIMEINPRITGSVKICYEAGVNFSKLIMQDYLGEPVDRMFNENFDTYLRYFHKDILWFIKSKDRFKTKPSWFSFKNCTDQIFSWCDMMPFFAYSVLSIKKLKEDKKKRSV